MCRRIFLLSLSFLIPVMFLISCKTDQYHYPDEFLYSIPVDLDDGLTPVSLGESGVDMSAIEVLFMELYSGAYGEIHSVIGAYEEKIFLEEYYPGKAFRGGYMEFNAGTMQSMASVTKSICSLLVGIAIDQGFIKSIDEPFMNYYPDFENTDPLKGTVTIRHLLTMTSGLEWDETTYSYDSRKNDVVRFNMNSNPIGFVLDRSMATEPGTQWGYNGGGVNLLGDIVKRASGMDVDEFADRFLFQPMGIESAEWIHLKNDTIYTSGDIELTPRDLLKIGLLVLNRGIWNGKRIISEEWIEESTAQSLTFDDKNGYGYLWWTGIFPIEDGVWTPYISARGWGDQYLYVVPEYNLVYVSTGGNYENPSSIDEMLGMLARETCRVDFGE